MFADPANAFNMVGVGMVARTGVIFYTGRSKKANPARLFFFSSKIENASLDYHPIISVGSDEGGTGCACRESPPHS